MTDRQEVPAGLVARVARWSIRNPGWAVGGWLAFVVAAVLASGAVETRQAVDRDFWVGESGQAERWLAGAGFVDPPTEQVLVTPHGRWDAATAEAAAADATERLRELPEVAEVGPAVAAEDADALVVPVTLAGDRDAAVTDAEAVLAQVAQTDAEYPDLRVEAVGGLAVAIGIDEVIMDDLAGAGLLSIPVTLGILLVVFGVLVAAGVPLLLGFSAVLAATGLWAFASYAVPDIGTVPQVILLIGLAVGVDYSLFYLRRLREERHAGHDRMDALRLAAATSGRAVVVSGVTSIVALAGLYLADDVIFRALGTGVILVIGVAMVGSVTVLPALLGKLGRAVERPRVPLLWRLTRQRAEPRLWPALLAPALRAPRSTLLVTLLVLLGLAAPAAGMSLRSASEDDLPRDIPVVQAYDRLVAAFPEQRNTHQVVVAAPAGQAGAVRAALADLADRAADSPLFTRDTSAEPRTAADGTVSTVELPVPHGTGTPEAVESLELLRGELVPAALGDLAGAEVAVAGITAENVDYADHQRQRLPWVIGFVVLLTVSVMALAFRSAVVALVAGALNLVSVAAAFGLLTLVFQHTWAEGLLGFSSSGHIVQWVPLFLFVVLFGLSMDYHVYVVSRIREAAAAGLSTRAAVRAGLMRAAGVVTSAAAVMVAVFSVFATLSFLEMKQLGVGLAAAIAIDAVLVRLFLLPALMNLLGRANWWPSVLTRAAHPAGAHAAAVDRVGWRCADDGEGRGHDRPARAAAG